jgi:hypothetical protein
MVIQSPTTRPTATPRHDGPPGAPQAAAPRRRDSRCGVWGASTGWAECTAAGGGGAGCALAARTRRGVRAQPCGAVYTFAAGCTLAVRAGPGTRRALRLRRGAVRARQLRRAGRVGTLCRWRRLTRVTSLCDSSVASHVRPLCPCAAAAAALAPYTPQALPGPQPAGTGCRAGGAAGRRAPTASGTAGSRTQAAVSLGCLRARHEFGAANKCATRIQRLRYGDSDTATRIRRLGYGDSDTLEISDKATVTRT